MTIKVKFRENGKATIKFKNKYEEQWFCNQMVLMRDSDPKVHPQMIVRDENGSHVPRIPKPSHLGKPIVVPKPETIIENGTLVTKNSGPTPPIITKKPLVH